MQLLCDSATHRNMFPKYALLTLAVGYLVIPCVLVSSQDIDAPIGAASLAFVFDITGSMYDDLVQVIEGAAKILATALSRREKPLYNYVLVPFHDPDIGPYLVTSDPEEFQRELRSLYVQGGGDCPEMSVGAIQLALEVSLPNSFIYVFTDARSKDYYLTEDVLALIQQKQSQVVFVLTGDCGNNTHRGYKAYEEIASTSSGQVFLLKKSDVNQVLNFVRVTVQARKVNLMSVDEDEAKTQTFTIPIDSKLQEITVSVSGKSPRIILHNPFGSKLLKRKDDDQFPTEDDFEEETDKLRELLNITNVLIYNVKDPTPGLWQLEVGSLGPHTIRVTGLSTTDFAAGFAKKTVQEFSKTDLRPVKGVPTHILINATNLDPPAILTKLELVDLKGNQLAEFPVFRDPLNPALYNVTSFIPPDNFFYLKVDGVDDEGFVLRRTTPTAISPRIPTAPTVYMADLTRGFFDQTAVLTCIVDSLVPYAVRWVRNGKQQGYQVNYFDSANVTLEIPRAGANSEGDYYCNASNIAGYAVTKTYLDISDPPPVISKPANVSVLPGDDAILSCHAYSIVEFNMSWVTPGRFSYGHLDPRIRILSNGSLFIRNAQKQDEGMYMCKASNEGGSSEAQVFLRLQETPLARTIPVQQNFVVGHTVNITCVADGFPEPTYTWLQGGKYIVPMERMFYTHGVLTIRNIQRADEGNYECLAKNTAGEDIALSRLTYIEAPNIRQYERRMLVATGDKAVLYCNADGIPYPRITWYRGKRKLQAAYNVAVTQSGQLIISNVEQADEGEYRCVATNEAGRDQAKVVLKVGSPPSIVIPPGNVGIEIEKNGSLQCEAIGIPPPKIIWRRGDGKPLDSTGRFQQLPSGGLAISNIQLGDEGIYSCLAQNTFGVADASAFVSVTGIVRPLIAYTYPFIKVQEGDTAELECVVLLGKPAPSIMWMKNRRVIRGGGRIRELAPGRIAVTNITHADDGEYICVASNIGGNATYSINVDVLVPPKLLQEPIDKKSNFSVIQGRGVVLPCRAQGDPPPSYQWYKDGSPISLSDIHYFVREDGSLEIFSANPEDTGLYKCVVSNVAGGTEKDVTLFVQVGPSISGALDEQFEINEGEDILLPCDATGTPKPIVFWRRNFTPFRPKVARITFQSNGLFFKNAKIKDKAIYECIASNIAGNTTKVITLIVYIPPSIDAGDLDLTVLAGDRVTLHCETSGDPTPSVQWKKDNVVMDLSDASRGVFTHGTGSVTVDHARLKDSALYTCSAVNPAGAATQDFRLTVHAPPALPPSLPSYTEIIENNPVILLCPATGTPPPTMVWLKDGLPISGNELDMVVLDDGSLELASAQAADSGQYRCVAQNVAGNTSHTVNLKILVPPKLIQTDESDSEHNKPTVIVNDTKVITCPVAEDVDPPPIILWYKDEQLIEYLGPDARVVISNDGRELVIKRAVVDDTARYRCIASNTAGEIEKHFDLDVLVPPTVDEESSSLPNLTVVIGKSLSINCPLTGIPPPVVKWFKDGEPVDPELDANIVIHASGRRLELRRAKVSDRGLYKCVGQNVAGDTSREYAVIVHVPPEVEKPGEVEQSHVIKGGNLSMSCPISGIPLPEITWLKNEVSIKENSTEYLLLDGGWTLVIRDADELDSGRYYCLAQNEAGENEKAFDVQVWVPPNIKRNQTTSTPNVIINNTAVMNCPVGGNPTPEIVWYRNGVLLEPTTNPRYEILADGRQVRVHHTQYKDRGRYTCSTRNRAGDDSLDFQLDVWVPPKIDTKGANFDPRIIVNGTISMDCRVSGNPPPVILWLKDNQAVTEDDDVTVLEGGARLEVRNAAVEDTGRYSCVVRNDAGETDIHYNLAVHVPPVIPDVGIITNPRVIENETVVLDCPALGIPPPTVVWYQNDQPLNLEVNSHISIQEAGRRLVIDEAQVPDAGKYTCRASNEAGEAENNYELEVWVPPMIDDATRDKNPRVIKGQTASMTCPVSGIPFPSIQWLKNNQEVTVDGRTEVMNSGLVLRIANATEADTALYTCFVISPAGEDRANYNLVVLVPPAIDESNVVYNPRVIQGRRVLMECPVSGIPIPEVEWLKDGQPLVTNAGLRLLHNNLHLEIVRSQVEDTAQYTCIASNEAGELVRNFNLEVLVPPTIDKSATQDNLSVVQNKTITISCPVSGIPPPSMLWLKDRTPLLDFPYRDLRVLNQEQTLEVSNAQLNDAGKYTCKATNPAGQDTASFSLEVFVPPSVPNDKVVTELNVVLHDSATLECQAQGIPKPSVLWLKDGKIIEEENDHQVAMVSDGRVLTIKDTQTRHTGRYKCHAENQAGFTEKLYDLNIMVPPTINGSGEIQEKPIIIDSPVLLECPAEGIPSPSITWFRQGQPIPAYGIPNIRIHNAGRQLQVQSAQLLDSGEYRCLATNDAGQENLDFLVFIMVPPEIAEGETRIAAQLGSHTVLQCEASGQPSPTVTWVKDGEVFPSTSLRHRQLHGGSIEFSNIHLEDAGSYTCTASNDAGNKSRTIELNVQVPARILRTGPQTVRTSVNKAVILPCDVQGTPPPRILWLKNRAVLRDNEGFEVLENGSLSIGRISLGHSGMYTCIAQNYAGIDKRDLRLQVQVPPRIQVSQRQFEVLQNRTVVMPCHARGNPQPTIQWLKDGQEITSGSYDLLSYSQVHYITLQTGGLAIPHARAEDTGNYKCIAKNEAGNASVEMTLTVQIPPLIEAASKQYVVSVAENAVLPCNASGIPLPKVSWRREGRLISSREPKYIIKNDGTLVVQQVKAGDSGQYICTAENEAGRDTRSRLLRVQVPPRFIIRPQNLEISVSERLELRCAAEGIPTPSLTWLHNGEQLPSPPSINGRSSYIVRNAMRADAGRYTCVASNPASNQKVTTTSQVVVKVPPRMLVPPGNRAVKIAEKVVLACSVRGDPIPEILWTKNGRPVELSHRIQQLSNGSLVIYDSTASDAGEYRCIAVNDAGTSESAAYLTVWSEPSFGIEPPRSTKVDQGQTVTLDCTGKGVPKPDMYWWKLTTPIVSEGRFTILPNNSLRIVATQLNDSSLYRCFASNKIGKTFVESELKVVVHGSWGEWGKFGACSSSCGTGLQYRTRSCDNPEAANGGKQCIGDATDSSSCLTADCPVNGNWGNWQAWQSCTSTCGPGRRGRQRLCNNPPPEFGGRRCDGPRKEADRCSVRPCPVDGKWGEWSHWSPCSVTCGEGHSTRWRKCDSPYPQYGGLPCSEEDTDRKQCRAQACAVDGQWSAWNEWSACSLSCGGGMMLRSRRCDNPRPQHGGSNCLGIGEQKDYCNSDQCPIHGNWAPWSEFGECSVSCNSGKRRRFRTCTNPVPTSGGRSCVGPAEGTDVCNTQPCPVNGDWAEWGQWSQCSKTCDTGSRERHRKCRQPQHGGRPCRGDNVQRADCVVKSCDQTPRVAMGNLIGNINNIDIVESTIVSEMDPTTSGTKITATVRNVPTDIARHLQHLISLLTPVYWTTATEIDSAVNGYTLTKGQFNREVQVEFATGEIVKMTHYVTGVNKDGVLNYDIIIRGDVPDLGPIHHVYLAPYNEQYIQTGPGTLYAYSSRLFHADGRMMPYAWNHTITYNPELGRMPYLVQELYTEAIDVSLGPNHDSVHFQLLASIAPGSPSNQCPSGFFHDEEGSYCRDDNECERLRPCSHYCHNAPGSYACSCPSGFTLKADGQTCRDIDECEAQPAVCSANQECINVIGSHECVTICTAGFVRNPDTLACQDVNECDLEPKVCEQTCQNVVGSYQCSCSRGYRLDRNGRCKDINECEGKRTPCFQKCINTRGSYRCACRKGFKLASDGNNCIDINECFEGLFRCRSDEECINSRGSYKCIDLCKRGYRRLATGQCEDIDECATGQHRCFYNQKCVNKPGSYYCHCPRGFTSRGPGQPCTDINECLHVPRLCTFGCVNSYGGYECVCAPGQIRLADNKSCAGLEFVEPSRIFSTGELPNGQSFQTTRHSRFKRQASARKLLATSNFIPAVKAIPCKYGFCALKRPRLKCPQGTKRDLKHKDRCLDIDECHKDHHPCQYNCTNIVGWYRCTCPPGYRLGVDRHKCVDINECVEQRINCGSEKMCFNTRGSYTCIDIPCPMDYARDPTTQYCVLECVNPKIPCPPGAKYADVIQYHTLSLPGGTMAQDLIRLTAFNQDNEVLVHTTFNVLDNDPKLKFKIRMEGGKGVVFTLVPLQDGNLYRIKVKAKSYDNQHQHIQYQTTFIIHISVSHWPF